MIFFIKARPKSTRPCAAALSAHPSRRHWVYRVHTLLTVKSKQRDVCFFIRTPCTRAWACFFMYTFILLYYLSLYYYCYCIDIMCSYYRRTLSSAGIRVSGPSKQKPVAGRRRRRCTSRCETYIIIKSKRFFFFFIVARLTYNVYINIIMLFSFLLLLCVYFFPSLSLYYFLRMIFRWKKN